MAEHTNAEPENRFQGDLVFPEARHFPIEDADHARNARARTIGTPEHAALVASVKRNFPEIYEMRVDDAGNAGQSGKPGLGSFAAQF